MKNPYNDKITRTDDFWDMDGLLPERKSRRIFSNDIETVEIAVPGSAPAKECGETIPQREEGDKLRLAREALRQAEAKQKLRAAVAQRDVDTAAALVDRLLSTPATQAKLAVAEALGGSETETPSDEVPLDTYVPEGNPLIEAVTVKPWPTRYSFYESFRKNALRYADKTAEPCEAVPFFSYTPQYVQLSKEQLRYYLYWRSEVKAGRYPPADYAYVLLFLYEIINLPDKIPPREGVDLLCRIWEAYREIYPKLDRNLTEWVCDYCLIHHLTPPAERYARFFTTLLHTASLKEFYVGYDGSTASPYASALFSYCSSYNWRNSKFITAENRHLFEKHIRGAFLHAWGKAEAEHKTVFAPVGKSAMVHAVTTRDAFSGALCCFDQKRRIEVKYLACSRSIELRYTVTDTVKYAENQVRGLLGIRSRFHTPNLPMPLRQAVDEYFAPYKKAQKKEADPAPVPAYDVLYEPERSDLSLDYAKAIEKQAWATTELLVEAEEEASASLPSLREEAPPVAPAPVSPMSPITPPPPPASSAATAHLTEALALCLEEDSTGFSALARSRNLLPDALAEAVNDFFYDVIGDAVLEEGEQGYRVVSDYREDLIQWMKT